MNRKRYLACIIASLFATMVALSTLMTWTNELGTGHSSPYRVFSVTLPNDEVGQNPIPTPFRDPPIRTAIYNTRKSSRSSSSSSRSTTTTTTTTISPSPPTTTELDTSTVSMSTSKPSSSKTKTAIISVPKSSSSPLSSTSTSSKLKKTIPSPFYVCVHYMGRLGNNLFQSASGFGIAFAKNMKFVVRESDFLYKIFKIKNSDHLLVSKQGQECAKAAVRGEARASGFDPNLLNFQSNTTVRVASYLQSYKYFHNASQELREQFQFRDHIQSRADEIRKGILQKYNVTRENVTLIAIHNRRGDMVNHNFGYNVATKEYFEKAMQFFSNYSSPIFILCSNDLAWSKANIPKSNTVEIVSGNTAEVDLALMASCDHVITSVGSYSWWAGWFSNGTVTYYKWPAKEGSGLRAAYSSDYMDYFYPNWIGF